MPKPKTKSVSLGDLTRLVTWLDAFSAMSPIDPLRLKRIAKRYESDHDISTAWKDVEKDVWDIAKVPSSSSDITRLSRFVGILKQVLMFVGLIVFTIYIIGTGIGALNSLGQYGALVFALIFVLAYGVGFALYFHFDRKLTNLVTRCYSEHSSQISKQRKHIKQVNQRLIDKLASEIRAKRADPSKHTFSLMQKDYSNIIIQKERGNSQFLVSIKGAKKSESE